VVAGPAGERPRGFLSIAPGPLVHGLTAGEMARYVNARSARRAELVVVPMAGWRREMTWRETGRRWIAPSPNLRSPDAALLYPGTALLEGTNVSEGRGSTAPFQMICAPWLDAAGLIRRVARPGIALRATTFVPRASTAAPDPKYAGVRCRGVRIDVTRSDVDGFRLGLDLLRALRRSPRFAWLGGGATIDTLVGTSRLRRAIDRGASVEAIVSGEAAGVRAWKRSRAAALLYP
jgi:uncharacterized protein YbbC (DUF1343 family)